MNEEKKILLDVEVVAANALKELAHMQLGIDNIKKAQKELDTSTMELCNL
ncbi:MAG: hypothetical protein RSA67_02555 [Alistipes sp.]